MATQRRLHTVEHESVCLIAIGMDMHLHALFQCQGQRLAQLVRRYVPQAIGSAIIIARRFRRAVKP